MYLLIKFFKSSNRISTLGIETNHVKKECVDNSYTQ